MKIEPGARSDTAPTESRPITAFLGPLLEAAPFDVRCVHPRRTFWEKAMLVHEELSRDATQVPRPRLARHFYDLTRLIETGYGDEALNDTDLFESVRQHRNHFFRKAATVRDSMRAGTFRLVPSNEQRAAWERDYEAMREAMFYGEEPPEFGEILRVLGEFEARLNSPEIP